MYSETPEDHLQSRGLLYPIEKRKIIPIEPESKHSPCDKESFTKEKIEHSMKIQDIKLEAEIEQKRWQSCCFQLEPESSVFFSKLIVSILVIILCSYQLITLADCQYQSLYSSLLSSVITYWLSKTK
jgi:hypothetical protein